YATAHHPHRHTFPTRRSSDLRAIEEEKLVRILETQNFISWKSEHYPQLLLNLPYPPLFLFYAGNLDLLETPLLAFVGARKPRARSEEHTSELQSRFDLVCRLL